MASPDADARCFNSTPCSSVQMRLYFWTRVSRDGVSFDVVSVKHHRTAVLAWVDHHTWRQLSDLWWDLDLSTFGTKIEGGGSKHED